MASSSFLMAAAYPESGRLNADHHPAPWAGKSASLCHDVIVLRDGVAVEVGPTASVFAAPQHEHTRAQPAAVPRLPAS
jgi:hypothetical protein